VKNCNIPSDPIFSTITDSCRQRKSRSNYLAALEESFLVEGERRREKGRRYPFELARGRAAWWRPICDASNSTPPRDIFHLRRVASYIHMRAMGDAHAARRGQNLSAMHDRLVAYRLRRAARHYARGKQKDERLAGRPIAVRVLMNLNRPDQWWGSHTPVPLMCPM